MKASLQSGTGRTERAIGMRRIIIEKYRQKGLLDLAETNHAACDPCESLLAEFSRLLTKPNQRSEMAPLEWGDRLADSLQRLQLEVQRCFDMLESPCQSCPPQLYPILQQLCLLHRTITEMFVLIRNVSGQCRRGRLYRDPTDSYGQLCQYGETVQQNCQLLGRLWQKSMATAELPRPMSTPSFLHFSRIPEKS